MLAGPVSDVVFPESPSVPLPPPANANPWPFFQTFTCVRLPSASCPRAVTVYEPPDVALAGELIHEIVGALFSGASTQLT